MRTLLNGQVSTYSFESHSKTSQIRIHDIKTGQSSLVFEDSSYSEPTWIGESHIVFFKSGEKDSTSLLHADVSKSSSRCVVLCFPKSSFPKVNCLQCASPNEIYTFEGSVSNLKIKQVADDEFAIVVSALTTPSGSLYNSATEKKSRSSAKAYSDLFVRHWDSWQTDNKNELWYGLLKKSDDKYELQGKGLHRLTGEDGPRFESPVPPFGGTSDFDVSSSGIVFVSRDPDVSPATTTTTNLYYVPLKSFTDADPPLPQQVKTGDLRGYSSSPVFSPDGTKVAFARMKHHQYESDKPRLLLIPDIKDLSSVQEFYETKDGRGGWDTRPDSITWSNDGKQLFITAEHRGRTLLWSLPSSPAEAKDLPTPIFSDGSVTEAKPLGTEGSQLFVTSTSLVDSSCYSVLDPASKSVEAVSSSSKHGKSFGLSRSQCDEFWYKGAEGYDLHALVVKPSHFDEKKRYPLAFLIHGGPQGAWLDSWSTRWNPAIFAEQGYVAVMPNPTGSTGYGTWHTDAIQEEWGGRPYVDLVKCWEYIAKELPYVDTDNGVALGASYGGYMISENSRTRNSRRITG